jgi:hypothetical protein
MRLGKVFSVIAGYYNTTAAILLNCLILFLVVNLLADGALDIRQDWKKKAAKKAGTYSYRKFHPDLRKVHPRLDRERIDELISETGRLSQGYEPYTQFKENPCRTQFVNVDPHGFRPIKDQHPWPPRKEDLSVFVFGGSTAFGYGVADDRTIASYLQELLDKASPRPVKVYNFGRGSYMSVQERILLEQLILRGAIPDYAVFIDGLNDLCFFDGNPAYTKLLRAFMAEGKTPAYYKALKELPVVKAFSLLVPGRSDAKASSGKFPCPRDLPAALSRYVERYRLNKRITESVCRGFGVTPIFVWQPVPAYKHDQRFNIFGRFDLEGYMPTLKPGYELMAKTARSGEFGANFIWAADIQEDLKEPLYVDAIHYGGKLARMIAAHVVRVSICRGLMPSLRAERKDCPGDENRVRVSRIVVDGSNRGEGR